MFHREDRDEYRHQNDGVKKGKENSNGRDITQFGNSGNISPYKGEQPACRGHAGHEHRQPGKAGSVYDCLSFITAVIKFSVENSQNVDRITNTDNQ